MGNTFTKFRAAMVQLRSGREIAPNVAFAAGLIREAAAKGAEYIQTPENTVLLEFEPARLLVRTFPEAQTEAIETFSALAAELRVWLHIGSIAIRVEGAKVVNRAFVFTPDGGIAARYDKIHMFDVDLPGGESYRESKTYVPGNVAVNVPLPWGVLGVTTCYDLRFPEQYKALATAGASFLTVPSSFTEQTGRAHWHVLIRARAIETGSFVLAAAQGGMHETGRATYGHSMIVSPWGEILAEAGTEPGVILADIDPAHVEATRRRIPALRHVRPFDLELAAPDATRR